jgi:hypothetical protein
LREGKFSQEDFLSPHSWPRSPAAGTGTSAARGWLLLMYRSRRPRSR